MYRRFCLLAQLCTHGIPDALGNTSAKSGIFFARGCVYSPAVRSRTDIRRRIINEHTHARARSLLSHSPFIRLRETSVFLDVGVTRASEWCAPDRYVITRESPRERKLVNSTEERAAARRESLSRSPTCGNRPWRSITRRRRKKAEALVYQLQSDDLIPMHALGAAENRE